MAHRHAQAPPRSTIPLPALDEVLDEVCTQAVSSLRCAPMKKLHAFVVIGLGLAAAACGPALTFEGTRVQVAPSADSMANCQPISAVDVVGSTAEEAEILLRNKAGAMNADALVVTENLEAQGMVKLVGKAYSCKAAQPGGPTGG